MEFTRPTPEEIRLHKALIEAENAVAAFCYSLENVPSNSRIVAMGSVFASVLDKAHADHGWTIEECKQVIETFPSILEKTGFDVFGTMEVNG